MLKFIAEEVKLGGLLKAGKHIVKIELANWEESAAHSEAAWTDVNKQLKVVLRNKNGVITAFMNTIGYQNSKDFNDVAPAGHFFASFGTDATKYVVDKKTNERVESPERSEKMQKMIGNLLFAAGLSNATEKTICKDLKDAEVGVWVQEKQLAGKTVVEAYYFEPAANIAVSAELEA